MRRGWRLRVGLVLLLVAATCGRESAPTGGPGASGSVTIGRDGGRVGFGSLTLEVPAGALEEPTAITVRQLEDAPWGTIGPAYDFGPDGLTFAVPARLTIAFDGLELPAGTNADSLAVRVVEDGRRVPLGGGEVDAGGGTVSALVSHFSVFGIAADPAAEGGAGTRWEANGVVDLLAMRGGFPSFQPSDAAWNFDVASAGSPATIHLPDSDTWYIAVVHAAPDDATFRGNAVDYELRISP